MPKPELAVVTGASRGIGYCIAKGLAVDGYKTILIARNEEKLRSVCQEISELVSEATKPEYVALDATDHARVTELAQKLIADYDAISVLVNNAGIWLGKTLEQSAESFQRILDVNLVAPFVLMKTIGTQMRQQGKGHIFNIASRAGKYGFPDSGLYSSSKFGLVGLSESLYRELAQSGVKVTAICPGWVNTDMATEAGASVKGEDMIQPADILASIRYVLGLSQSTCIREIVIECAKSTL